MANSVTAAVTSPPPRLVFGSASTAGMVSMYAIQRHLEVEGDAPGDSDGLVLGEPHGDICARRCSVRAQYVTAPYEDAYVTV